MMRLFAFLSLFIFAASTSLACNVPENYVPIIQRAPKALLYQVHGCDQPVRYVFGTYHSDAPQLAPILEEALPFLAQSQRLWVEIVSTPELIPQTQALLMLPAEVPNLQTLVGDSLFEEIKRKIAPLLGLSEAQLQRFRPWALALLVQYPPPSGDGIILDIKLQQLAARKAVGVSGLETLKQQFAIFQHMPEALQTDFLRYTLAEMDTIQSSIRQLEALYLSKDIWAIQALSEAQFDAMRQSSPPLADYLQQHLVTARNDHMARHILQKMPHTAFVAVGALHLTGERGLLAQLEQAGLQVDAIDH